MMLNPSIWVGLAAKKNCLYFVYCRNHGDNRPRPVGAEHVGG